MAITRTPTRTQPGSVRIPTSTSSKRSRGSRSATAQAEEDYATMLEDCADTLHGNGSLDGASLSSRRTGTPRTTRKRKADVIDETDVLQFQSPTATDLITVQPSTRSSGRARRQSAKLLAEQSWTELEMRRSRSKGIETAAKSVTEQKAVLPQITGQEEEVLNDKERASPVHQELPPTTEVTPSKERSRSMREEEDKSAQVIGDSVQQEPPLSDATPSRRRGRPKGSKNKPRPAPSSELEHNIHTTETRDTHMLDSTATEAATIQADTPRKRGRPKGSKNRKSLNTAGDPPFADISIDPRSKSTQLPQLAKLAVHLAEAEHDRELEELIANNQQLASVQAPQVPPLPADHGLLPTDEQQPAFNDLAKLLEKPTQARNFGKLREEILLRLSGKSAVPLVGMTREYEQVHSLIEQTVAVGEGNSMLIIGNRGVGKTALVETALASVSRNHANDFYVIRLNGFIHTDDKLALREIWRQLGRAMDVQDPSQSARTNYADTLASLLAVLSHPSEISGEAASTQTSKSVVFVLDEFDLFASHPRQTLLYNLLDIAQSRKAPIAVLGLTTKIDVTEMLEKRVKSRFSHRYVYVQLPRNYTTFLAIIQAALHCDPEPGFSPPHDAPQTSSLSSTDPLLSVLRNVWTAHIATALRTAPLSHELQRIYATTKSIPTVMTSFLSALLSHPPPALPTSSLLASRLSSLSPPDSKLTLLPSLSESQLALLVAAARCDVLLATDAVNFLLAYDEYVRCTTRARVAAGMSTGASARGSGVNEFSTVSTAAAAAPGMPRIWSREVCLAAWEGLTSKNLLVPVLGTDQGMGGRLAVAAGGAGDAGKRGRLWRVDVSLDELGRTIQGWGGAAREIYRWCRNL